MYPVLLDNVDDIAFIVLKIFCKIVRMLKQNRNYNEECSSVKYILKHIPFSSISEKTIANCSSENTEASIPVCFHSKLMENIHCNVCFPYHNHNHLFKL